VRSLPATAAFPAARRRSADASYNTQGTANAGVFELWFLLVLLPVLAARHPAGCTIVLDNASIHRAAVLRALLIGTNFVLVFLPAYSPEKNPVRVAPRPQHGAELRTHAPRRGADRAAVFVDEVRDQTARRSLKRQPAGCCGALCVRVCRLRLRLS